MMGCDGHRVTENPLGDHPSSCGPCISQGRSVDNQRMPALIGRIVSAMLCVPVWGLMVRKLAALAVAGWLVSPVARFDTTAKKAIC